MQLSKPGLDKVPSRVSAMSAETAAGALAGVLEHREPL
jgi:hypothetical protein